MYDVQNSRDFNGLKIDRVGVSDLRYPVTVLDKNNQKQQTVANISISVDLPHQFKGTHMSRFIEVLNKHHREITIRNMDKILAEVARVLEASSAHMEVAFTYFIEKEAPVSKMHSHMDYRCRFIGEYEPEINYDFILEVTVPVTTLCPCSKEISDSGAHNQRSEVTVQVRFNDFYWIEELVEIVEQSASSPVYALLKRVDEKHVTEKAYENPRFVEDIVRIISKKLLADDRIDWFLVKSVNHESIHNHNAYAVIERDKGKKMESGNQ